MSFSGKDILSAGDFGREEIEVVLKKAKEFEDVVDKKEMVDVAKGKIMASLFFEPSTRTRLSFETAMTRLGGQVISVSGKESSSMNKGETISDTGKTIEQYANLIVMRSPMKGEVAAMADSVDVPVLNAGDGAGEHPTQGLLDLYTIQEECGKIDGLKIAMVGDLKYGRTVHSLVKFLMNFEVEFVFVSPEELAMPQDLIDVLDDSGMKYELVNDLNEAVGKVDVVYMTRIQQERFEDRSEYERLKGSYVLERGMIESAGGDVVVLHPLPRVDEIAKDVDELAGAAYFRQARNGVKVRMALLSLVLGV